MPEGKRDSIKGLQVYELKSMINTPDVPNVTPRDPEEGIGRQREEQGEFDLDYHFERRNVKKEIKEFYAELDSKIRGLDDSIWVKYAQTAITYYSPEKVFVYLHLQKGSMALTIYTGQNAIAGVSNVKDHENWGKMHIDNKKELPNAFAAIQQSFEIIKQAVKNNENTGWYALTPKDKFEDVQ